MPGLDESVKVTLDKERHLRLTLKGMLEFEKITGKNLLKGIDFATLTFKDTAALMWACLIHEDKELAFDDFLCMVDFSNLMMLTQAVVSCINQSMATSESSEDSLPLEGTSQAG